MKTMWLCMMVAVMLSVSAWAQQDGWPQPVNGAYRYMFTNAQGEVVVVSDGINPFVLNISKWNSIGRLIWSKVYEGNQPITVGEAVTLSNGTVIVGGTTRSNTGVWSGNKGNTDAFLISIDSGGNLIYFKWFGDTQNDAVNKITTSNDGGIFVAGVSCVYGNCGFLMKLDLNGNICPLGITTHPSSSTVSGGHQTSMAVTATSTETITYQWQRQDGSTWVNVSDGADYGGSTSATLTIKQAKLSKKGPYRCAVSAGECTLYSNEATLTVNCPCNE